jgi:hypothetical protein
MWQAAFCHASYFQFVWSIISTGTAAFMAPLARLVPAVHSEADNKNPSLTEKAAALPCM